jgi:hypothetical protein
VLEIKKFTDGFLKAINKKKKRKRNWDGFKTNRHEIC